MGRKTKIKGFSIDKKNAHWLAEACEKEGLNESQVVNKAIKKMRKSGILW